MGVRVRFGAVAAFIVVVGFLDSVRGLAGPVSDAVAFLPLLLLGASLLHLAWSVYVFGFHQDFSTDHPAKGERVEYTLHVRNELPIPMTAAECRFSAVGPGSGRMEAFPLLLGSNGSAQKHETIVCAYRGVYAIGAERFSFRDALGLLEIDHRVEPRVFYVYPELVRLGSAVERMAEGGGEGRPVPGGQDADPGVFDAVAPLVHGRGARRIAWKRWAATGIPCEVSEGGVSAYGLRVVLDLRPSETVISEEDRLVSEDLAVTAVFSVLRRLVERSIPAEFVLGGEEAGAAIEDRASFDAAYDASTNILFTDSRFPGAAFRGGRAALLVSVRSIAGSAGETGTSLFDALEAAAANDYAVRVITVPPPSDAEREQARIRAARERLRVESADRLCLALDTRRGTEDLVDAFLV